MTFDYGNHVSFTTPTIGTGTMTVGVAATGYQLPVTAGVASGSQVGYSITDGANWEVGTGVYSSGTPPTITRNIVEDSSSGPGVLQNLSGSATVSLVVTAEMYSQYSTGLTLPNLQGDKNGVIVPYYLYPNNPYTDPTVQKLINLIRQYHDVPCMVIVNAGSPGGPGTINDGNWAAFIKLLKAAGAFVLGYVDTGTGTRASNLVEADVLAWNTLYASTPVNGIFFDNFGYSTSLIPLYEGYYGFAHQSGYSYVVGNVGSDELGNWYSSPTADMIIMNEATTWPSQSEAWGNFVNGHGDYAWQYNGCLVYGVSLMDNYQFGMNRKFAKWFYVTGGTLPNPWNTLSAYLPDLFAACADRTGNNYTYLQPTTGFSITISYPTTILDPTGTLATGTLIFPAAPIDGAKIGVTSTHTVTSLTLNGNGSTISNPITTLTAGAPTHYTYVYANTTWYPS